MQLIEDLRAEHDLIDQMLGSLRTFVAQRSLGQGNPSDGLAFLSFFRLYAGDYHHAREEDSLFIALSDQIGLPADQGPIAALTKDHHRMAAMLDQMEPLIACDLTEQAAQQQLDRLAKDYSHALWHHMDAENSVLLPESEARLRKHGVIELKSREMTVEEGRAKTSGEELLRRYPPSHDPDIIRGDGCPMCPAFLDSCRGLEREWWNDWEWEEFEDHLPSG